MQRFLLAATVAAIAIAESPAAEILPWPRFRGPNGSGISESGDLPVEFGPQKNLLWRTSCPPGTSSPIVAGRRVFITGHQDTRLLLWCLDLQTGERLWERSLETVRVERKSKPNDAASSTPTTDGTNIYALFSGFGLVAYSLAGEERWRHPLGPFNPPHGMGSSPILARGDVIVLADQVTDSHIAAYDPASGKEKWRTARGNFAGGYATPVVAGDEIVAGGPVEMIGYAAATGQKRWAVPRMGVMPVASPVSEGNRIFVYNDALPPFEILARDLKGDKNGDGRLQPDEFPDPSFKEAVLAIDRAYGNGDGAIDQKEWDGALRLMNTMNALVAVRLNGTEATELWRTTKLLTDTASPLLYRNLLYLVKNGAILSCVDPASGQVIREERLGGLEGRIYASPVAGNGRIYLLNAAGKLGVIEAGGGEPRILALNDLEEPCYATPALAGNILLVRGEQTLMAFRKDSIKSPEEAR